MDKVHYIIGDIHGQANQLMRLLEMIQARHNWRHPDTPACLVYLGDYIDRGPDSARVIDIVMAGLGGFESIYLKGNHEALLLNVLTTGEDQAWRYWLAVGGRAALASFGRDRKIDEYHSVQLVRAIGREKIKWLQALKLSYQFNDFICVHAGFMPHIKLNRQNEKDMLWIRNRFLESDYDFGPGVIHGHTPSDAPIVKKNRIGIDTGAGMDGPLTALVVDKAWEDLIADPVFLQAP